MVAAASSSSPVETTVDPLQPTHRRAFPSPAPFAHSAHDLDPDPGPDPDPNSNPSPTSNPNPDSDLGPAPGGRFDRSSLLRRVSSQDRHGERSFS